MNDWTLGKLTHCDAVAQHLETTGLSPEQSKKKARLFAQSAEALLTNNLQASSIATALFVPGRIEVLGKHTDYAGGRSLTAAAEQGFCAIAVPRNDRTVRIITGTEGQSTEFLLEASLTPTVGHWSNYPMTVARRIAKNFPGDLRGADIALSSDLPPAAGMSSSSAIVITIFQLLADVNNLSQRDLYQRSIHNNIDLAGYLATIENGQSFNELIGDRGVGTFGGSEDHTAILCSQVGRVSQYSYSPTRVERTITMPSEYVFAIASSGVVAEKTGAALEKYNGASQLAYAAAEAWRKSIGRDDPHLAAVIASAHYTIDAIRGVLRNSNSSQFTSDQLLNRFEHFLAESEEIIPAVPETLDESNLAQFGELVDRSQSIAETLLQNQVPETIHLAHAARNLGAVAASAFGAGFGGSVWAMIRQKDMGSFLDRWSDVYRQHFPEVADRATFLVTRAGPPAMKL